jgi:hypothetical protein
MRLSPNRPARWRQSTRLGLLAALALSLGACTLVGSGRNCLSREAAERAGEERARIRIGELERERNRLRADLEEAEQTLVATESGLRGAHTRADAVSALAEGRIQVERAAAIAPWDEHTLEVARKKLDDADLQLQAGHFGSAMFFASRAARLADTLVQEARSLEQAPGIVLVRAERANVRSGPSAGAPVVAVVTQGTPLRPLGHASGGTWAQIRTPDGTVGWVHATLLRQSR